MKNPFLAYLKEENTEYMTPVCSLNRAVLAKLPLYGVEDEIEGRCFKDVFCTQLVVDEIKANAPIYGVDLSGAEDYMLPRILDKALVSPDVKYNQLASRVANKFGDRLGLLLLTLKLGEKENRDARPEWNDEHWQYWEELETVIFVGGLASSMLGRRFKERIQNIFDMAGVKPYNIMLFDNGTYVGAMGCALKLMDDNTTSVVFDFGHTNTKRCVVTKGVSEIREFSALESEKSQYVDIVKADEDPLFEALKLHKHIVKIIVETYKNQSKHFELSDKIIISIANYNAGGTLNSVHGGYAKLCELGDDYSKILAEDLSSYLHRRVKVKLVHDGTANALYFSEIEKSVCISLGTAFGVGFTDIDIK